MNVFLILLLSFISAEPQTISSVWTLNMTGEAPGSLQKSDTVPDAYRSYVFEDKRDILTAIRTQQKKVFFLCELELNSTKQNFKFSECSSFEKYAKRESYKGNLDISLPLELTGWSGPTYLVSFSFKFDNGNIILWGNSRADY